MENRFSEDRSWEKEVVNEKEREDFRSEVSRAKGGVKFKKCKSRNYHFLPAPTPY